MEDHIHRPLHWLVGNDENYQHIDERLDDPNEKNFLGFTLLHVAAESPDKNCKIMQLLLDRGADVDCTTPNGETPLHLAVCQMKRDAIIALIDAGASVNKKDKLGRTALHFAVIKRDNIRGNPYLNYHCDTWIVEKLLAHPQIDVNSVNNIGDTPLMWAVRGRHSRAVGPMLKRGANPNIYNKYWRTPLHEAFSARLPIFEVMRELLSNGAGIYSIDYSGMTPIDILVRSVTDNLRYIYATECMWIIALRYRIKKCLDYKLRKIPILSKYFTDCCNEIRMMKETIIYDNVTLHDIALDCFQKLVEDPVQEIYVPAVESLLSGLFEHYYEFILTRFSASDLRRVLEITAGDCFTADMVPSDTLNTIIFDEIGHFYSKNDDLKRRLLRFLSFV